MTTITEFIEYLQTLPEDTELYVVKGFYEGFTYVSEEVLLDIDGNTEFVDLTNNKFVKKGDVRENRKTLTLGEI